MILSRRALLGGTAALALSRTARAEPVLRVGDQKGGVQSLLKAAGLLDGLPYRVEWSQFAAAAPLLEALNADAVDTAFAGDAPTTFALAAGLRGKIISATRSSGASTAIMVRGDSPIRTAADLRGRTVATNRGSIGHALVLALIAREGWAPGDLTVANLLPSEAKSAWNTGAVDAWSSWNSFVAQARLVDGARVVVDGSGGLLTGLSYQVASDTAIAALRPALLDFTRRVNAGRRWAQTHLDEYARALAAEINVTFPVARLTYETDSPLPAPIDAGVVADEQRTIDLYHRARLIRERLDAGRVFDATFNESERA